MTQEFVIEFRSGTFFQNLEANYGGPATTAQTFVSKEEAEKFMDAHTLIYFAGGMAVLKKNEIKTSCRR